MNKLIIDKLTDQLILYKKDKSKKWKAIALQKAISNLKDVNFEIKNSNDVKDIKGIGNGILKRIDEILNTGTLEDLSTTNVLANENSNNLLNIFKNITGVGDVKALEWINLGYSSINDILIAVKDGKLEITHHIKIGLKYYEEFQKRIPQSEVKQIENIFQNILSKFNNKLSFHICGSYRRGCVDSGDIDILFTNFNDTNIDIYSNKYLSNLITLCKQNGFIIDDLTTLGEKKYMGVCKINNSIARRIDIRCVSKDEYYAALLYFTGSKNFNLLIRKKANSLGYSLNEYGLINKKNKILYPLKSEEELFEILKIPYVSPSDRNF